MVLKWVKRLKWMRISKYALIITLLLSLVFAGFTVYGTRTGNFTIYAHGSGVSLAIYMEEDRSDMNVRLTVPTLEQMDNITYGTIAAPYMRNQIMSGLGCKNDDEYGMYLAFSFVLVNLSDRMVNYDMELTVIDSRPGTRGAGEVINALRVLMLREEGYDQYGSIYDNPETPEAEKRALFENEETCKIYALPEASAEAKAELDRELALWTPYTTKDFISTIQIFDETVYDFDVGAETKFTVIMWLEGCDPECVNNILGGKIKMRLDIFGR